MILVHQNILYTIESLFAWLYRITIILILSNHKLFDTVTSKRWWCFNCKHFFDTKVSWNRWYKKCVRKFLAPWSVTLNSVSLKTVTDTKIVSEKAIFLLVLYALLRTLNWWNYILLLDLATFCFGSWWCKFAHLACF